VAVNRAKAFSDAPCAYSYGAGVRPARFASRPLSVPHYHLHSIRRRRVVSWQARVISFLLRHTFKPRLARARDITAVRKAMNVPFARALPGVRIENGFLGGVPGEWLRAQGANAQTEIATLIYFHGGGYFACSPRTHRPVTSAFALSGFHTFAPAYRLGPEHPFPAALEDALSVYRALLARRAAGSLVVAGDSAGGGLATALLVALREQGLPAPAAAALFSPYVDLAASGASVRFNSERCAMFNSKLLPLAAAFYVGERGDPRAPLASPLYADLHGLPPLLIHVGEQETLLDDSLRLAARAEQAGVQVRLKVWPDVPHVWQLFHRWIPEGRMSLREASEFLASHVSASRAAEAATACSRQKRMAGG